MRKPLFLALLLCVADAQEAPPNGPRRVDPMWHALLGATVHVRPGETIEGATVVIKGDVAADGASIVERALEELGGLDAVVLTAGVETLGRTLETTYDDFHRAMDVQVWGLLEVVRAAAPQLADTQGSVVAVSGITADHYAKYYGPIGPSKGALETMVRYLAAELGPRGIRVNAISPCLIADEDHWKPDEVAPFWEAVRRKTPLRRLATPDDIANTIVALSNKVVVLADHGSSRAAPLRLGGVVGRVGAQQGGARQR